MRTASRSLRLFRTVAAVVVVGMVVHPVAGIVAGLILLSRPGRGRRGPRRPAATRWLEGTIEVWDLRGVLIRMGAHELRIIGRHGPVSVSVHDLAGAETDGHEVLLVRQDGRRVRIGWSAADVTSVREAVVQVDAAIRRRTRGALDDRAALHQALEGYSLEERRLLRGRGGGVATR